MLAGVIPVMGSQSAGWGNHGSVLEGGTSTRRCCRLVIVRGGGGKRCGATGSRQLRVLRCHLCKGMLLLLSQNPSANPKVMEGHLVGNK